MKQLGSRYVHARLASAAAAALFGAAATPALAVTTIWDGGGPVGNTLWNTATNWVGDVVPPAANDIEFASGFGSGTTIELNGNRVANSINLNTNTHFAISGDIFGFNRLTLSSGNITRTAGSGNLTIDATLFLGQSGTWNVPSSDIFSSSITVYGPIGESASGRSLTKLGARVTLAAGGTYSGGTFVNSGPLRMENAIAGSGPITVAPNATLEIGNLTAANPIAISGEGSAGGFGGRLGALHSLGPTQLSTLNGPITLQANATIVAGGPLAINGVISDGASSFLLTLVGSSGSRLNAANTYDGGTLIRGRVIAGHPDAFGSGVVRLDADGRLELPENMNINRTLRFTATGLSSTLVGASGATWSGPIEVGILAEHIVQSTADFTISGNINGGTLTIDGPGRVIVTGNNSGAFKVSAGTLSLRSNSAAGISVTVDGGEAEIVGSLNVPQATLDLSGPGPSGHGALRVMSGSSTWGGNIEVHGDAPIFVASGAQLTASGTIFGTQSGFRKTGPGTLILSGAGQYDGTTFLETGTLSISADSNLGPGPANISGTLLFNTSTTTSRNFNLNGGRLQAVAGASVSINGSTISGGFLMGPGSFTSGGEANFNGVTALAGSTLTPSGPTLLNNYMNGGNLILAVPLTWSGGSNHSSGKITLNSGTLSTTAFSNEGVITINSGGTLLNTGNTLTSGGGSRITINPGGMLKVGPGLELNGALLVNNGTINGPTNVNYGSLAKGAGTYGAVNVTDGGKFSPGNSPGSVTTGATTWNSGGNYVVELADALGSAGADWDLWNIAGLLDINASPSQNGRFTISLASLSSDSPGLAANFDFTRDYTWKILSAADGITGFDPAEISLDISGFKNNLADGQFSLESNSNALIVHFSAVPEPAAIGLFGAASVLGMNRRRRRDKEPV